MNDWQEAKIYSLKRSAYGVGRPPRHLNQLPMGESLPGTSRPSQSAIVRMAGGARRRARTILDRTEFNSPNTVKDSRVR